MRIFLEAVMYALLVALGAFMVDQFLPGPTYYFAVIYLSVGGYMMGCWRPFR